MTNILKMLNFEKSRRTKNIFRKPQKTLTAISEQNSSHGNEDDKLV